MKHVGAIADSLSLFVQTLGVCEKRFSQKTVILQLLTYRDLTVDLRSILIEAFSKDELRGYHVFFYAQTSGYNSF